MDDDAIMGEMTDQTTINQNQRPEVSVVVITYNQARYICQAIDSILMQQTNFTYEIILADDCSTDGTREICQEYQKSHPQQIKLLLRPVNLGPQNNAISALQAVSANYVALCEGDDFWTDPLKLQMEYDFLEENKVFAGVHTQVNYIDMNSSVIGSGDLMPAGMNAVDFSYLVQKNVIHTCSFFFRQSVLDEVLYKIINSVPIGDYILFLATAYKGPIGYLRKTTAAYRKNAGITSTWKFTHFLTYKLVVYSLFEKHFNIKKYRPALYASKKYQYYHLTKISSGEKQPHLIRFKYFLMLIGYSFLNLIFKPTDEPNKIKTTDVIRMASQMLLISKILRKTGLFQLYSRFNKTSPAGLNKQEREMKIAVVVPRFPCISETFILNQITGLIDLGCDVSIIAFNRPGDRKRHPDVAEYRLAEKTTYIQPSKSKWDTRFKAAVQTLFAFFRHPFFSYRLQKMLLADGRSYSYTKLFTALALLRSGCDIIHCHFGNIGLDMLPFMELFRRVKWITSFHGYDANGFVLEKGKDVYKELFDKEHLFTCNTNFTRQKIVAIGCPENNIYIIPESLKVRKFLMPEKRTTREAVTILTVGRMVEKKGYKYSIQAIADVHKTHKNIRYIIAGDGPLWQELHTLVDELKLHDIVEFRGALPESDIIELYHKADIFLLPSVTAANGDMEGQALVLQEAQAAELPVISTWHNGIPDGVVDQKTGFLVNECDFKAISKHLSFLIENSETRLKMGLCGKAFVLDKYDTSVVNEMLIKVYKEMLKDNVKRRQ